MDPILTRCGYRCDLCLAFQPNVVVYPENRQRLSDGWHRYFGFRIPPADIECEGCLSCEAAAKLIDASCPVRACVIERGLEHCAQCPDYPCDRLHSRIVTLADIEKRFGAAIPVQDRLDFIIPYENKDRLDELHRLFLSS